MNKLFIKECPLCGNSKLESTMRCTDFYATGEEFDIVSCTVCDFTFTQGVPVESEIGKYYDTPDYISHSDTQKGFMNAIYHRVRRYMLGKKAHIVERQSGLKSGRLLDIGTGTGYFSSMMQQRHWQVTAIEKNASARQFAKSHFNLHVLPETDLCTLSPNSFDVITLWHVMEHLEHLHETWDCLHQLLSDKGELIIAVPNRKSYDANKYKKYWAAYDVPRHLWHFGPNSIRLLADQHHFQLVDSYPMPFDAFYISMLSEKYQKHSFPMLRGLYSGLVGGIKSFYNKERSSSMIYVFRKKNQ